MAKKPDTVAAAQLYVEHGLEPIPLQPKGKNPIGKWAEPVEWTPETIAAKFRNGCNVGIALGDRSGGLVDIDFDWPEAAQVAGRMMSNMPSFGRQSSPGSHRLVRAELPKGRLVYELPKTVAERHSVERSMVLEIRGNGHQTMFPPSTHPSGEKVRWEMGTDVAPDYRADELIRCCGICAFLAVVVRFYPRVQGDRDNVCMALTGALVNAGLPDEEIDQAVTLVAEFAGDEEYRKRGGKAAATRSKAEAKENIWGLPELCKRLEIGEAEEELRKWLGGEARNTRVRTSREIVVTTGEMPAAVDQAEQALIEGGVEIYQRGETLVRPVRLEASSADHGVRRASGSVFLKGVAQPWLTEQFSRSATWWKFSGSKDGTPTKVRIDPPARIATAYLARVGEWRVDHLIGIVQAPTLRADLSVLQEPGYDERSRLLFDPMGVEFPKIEDRPSREDAEASLKVLERPFREFSFADEVSRSVAMAAVLTALIRPSLPTAPLFAFDAPVAGTGKSLMADTIGIIATGHTPAAMSQGHNPEEDQKQLSSVLMAGDQIIVIDNCERQVGGDFLNSMLTQEMVQARILGRSEMVHLPQRSLVFVTGNNLSLAGDITRRSMICRLDTQVERPERRQYDFNPKDEAAHNRQALVSAGLTMIRAYVAAGRPEKTLPKLGSFEEWSIVRETLVWLGMEDPADSQEKLHSDDPRKLELAEMLLQWREAFGESEVRVSDIATAGGYNQAPSGNPKDKLSDMLVAMTGRINFNNKSIGRALARHVDRRVGNLVLRARADAGGKLYHVEQIDGEAESEEPTTQPSPQEEMPF